MTWFVWRQHRSQILVSAALTAALALLLLVTGRQMSSEYRTALSRCAGTGVCGSLQLFQGSGYSALSATVTLTVAVPALLGLLWGAPLVATELEQGTHQFIWTQGVTRRRWITAKISWILLTATLSGGIIAAAVTWWSRTNNSIHPNRFSSTLQFDIQGLVPVASSVFAVALGITAGTVFRRVLPALAVTLGVFGALQLILQNFLRPHYLPAITRSFPLAETNPGPSKSDWVTSGSILDPHNTVVGTVSKSGAWGIHGLLPAHCLAGAQGLDKVSSCLAADGYRAVITYQPASRYWAFQSIESAILLTLAASLIAFSVRLITHRDA